MSSVSGIFPFEEHPLYATTLMLVIVFGAICFPLLFRKTAPYGRHLRKEWGPLISAKLAWVLMEAPSPIGFALVFWRSAHAFEAARLLLFILWQFHYVYRSFIFPFRMRGVGKLMPAMTAFYAFQFNCANGAMNAFAITEVSPHLTEDWLRNPRLFLGVAVFFAGWSLNQYADSVLRNLREHGDSGYKVPYGGLYRFVSCPNYLGEIIEWCGFALAASTPAACAFAFFTIANLVPRAVSHHQWYKMKFDNYPAERRALVPFLL